MEQEKLLLQLKELLQEEQLLKKREDIRPLISSLKRMQDEIRNIESQGIELQNRLTENEQKVLETESQMSALNSKIEDAKKKLYGTKGGPLKELLSFQQSVQKMEDEVVRMETVYLERIKLIDELKQARGKVKENIRTMKTKYNDDLKLYKEKSQKLEHNLAENQQKQNDIKEKFKPETLKLFSETVKKFPTNPVAVLRSGVCSGCHISVPSVLMVYIMEKKSLHRCDSCGRILIHQG